MLRSVGLYLVMVGIPVAGMSAVLHAGRGIRPPAAFGGSWRVELWPDSLCAGARKDTFQLLIVQSGPALRMETPNYPRFEGRVVGEGFITEGRDRRRIQGRRVPGGGGREFEGMVAGLPCGSATNTRIRATRLQLPRNLTGH